jgi:hypothetical protein
VVFKGLTKKRMTNYVCHFDFKSRWNEKKIMTSSLAFVAVVFDAPTQKIKPK